MPISPPREIAYRVLRRVESGRAFAPDFLQERAVSELREVDRRLATELVMGVLRWRGELDFVIEQLSSKPLKYFDSEVLTILRLGIYQIRFLERIPKSAVVHEGVEMVKAARKRSAAGLVNAVLRKCRPPSRPLRPEWVGELGSERKESLRRALPAWIFERWTKHFGEQGAMSLAWASVRVPPTTLRVAGEAERESIQQRFAEEGIVTVPGRYGRQALVVESGNIHASKIIHEGNAVIQDEASQLVGSLVAPRAGQRVLDLCAAPGIKTSQLATELGEGTLVACDLSASRLRTTARLLSKLLPGGLRLHLVRLDATFELPFALRFDRILVDVPCSGTGTLARNPEIKWRLRPDDLERLGKLQMRILRNAIAALAPGGRLVYSTCSLEPEENEVVVERVLRASPEFRLVSAEELVGELPSLYRFFDSVGYFRTRPDLHFMDGFFAAVIIRL